MAEPVIKKIYIQFKETKRFDLPGELLPAETGFNLLPWARELVRYYREEGLVVRPFDDLPPLRLSEQPGLETTIQDVHRFVVNDLNLIPVDVRKSVLGQAVSHDSAQAAWQQIVPMLSGPLRGMEKELVMEDLSWKFSPVSEILWAVTWIFIEREGGFPPPSTRMVSTRFPYYRWETTEGGQSLWEPEPPLCRREWLAMDLYEKISGG